MHEIVGFLVYEQDTVTSSTAEVERALQAVSVLGQARAQSSLRTLSVNVQAKESSNNTEAITTAESIMMIGVRDSASGEARDCCVPAW